MRFLVISSAPTLFKQNKYFAYSPYARELNIWSQFATDFEIISPTVYHKELILEEVKGKPKVFSIPVIVFASFLNILFSLIKIPIIIFKIFRRMQSADHIHLRCPGNVALLGSFIQIFFPSKPKTIKYAGNWDPNSKQPLSYRLQKWIVSNTVLSKNIKVLVYGNWPNQTKNIVPFFTASFSESEVQNVEKDFTGELKFLFVGSLVEGKQPIYAIRLVEELKNSGRSVSLKIFGEGPLRSDLENYVQTKNISNYISICGGVPLDQLKNEYKRSHLSILPSKSEGWPKAVAEAMFFRCVPVATRVSCVPWMLENGKRGILLNDELEKDISMLNEVLENRVELQKRASEAMNWSQYYTVEYFEKEIAKLL